jgi:hypothetical protein
LDDVDWSSLHKILSDTTRRSILELVAEKQALSYTEMMTLLQITNTGRLNYHLKALGDLVSKDGEGRYRLTERGQLAVSLLRTFPERAPVEKKSLSALKVTTVVVLVLIGSLLIVSLTLGVLAAAGPTYTSTSERASVSSQVIPQNATVSLTGFSPTGAPFSISWSASGPVYIYVLNETQYQALGVQHPSSLMAGSNFTGAPTAWVDRYYGPSGNSTVDLPQGVYYFFAGSSTPAVLDTFGYAQAQQPQQQAGPSPSPLFYLDIAPIYAIGALMLVLAWSIATRRVWR